MQVFEEGGKPGEIKLRAVVNTIEAMTFHIGKERQ